MSSPASADCNDFLVEDKKNIRFTHLEQIINIHCGYWHSLSCTKQAINELNNTYWSLLITHVQPFFNNNGDTSKIDRHKIISILEFAVIGSKPIHSETNTDEAQIEANSDFACILAWQIYKSFFLNEYKHLPGNYNLAKFFEEHKKFLRMSNFPYKKGETPPKLLSNLIFSNAATWYGIDQYVKAVNDKS